MVKEKKRLLVHMDGKPVSNKRMEAISRLYEKGAGMSFLALTANVSPETLREILIRKRVNKRA